MATGANRLHGHYWTLRPHLLGRLQPPRVVAQPWSMELADARLGKVRLSGQLQAAHGGRNLLLIVHGLGGSSSSVYTLRAATAAQAAGLCHLRLDLRGSDLRGEDLYHAGLVSDLDVALAAPQLARFENIFVLGYSLGGHVALRYAALGQDPRVRAIASICPPLDLAASARAFDAARFDVYRLHVLRGLRAMYRAFAARRPEHLPAPLARMERIRRIQDWDELIVAPLHGFDNAAQYYDLMSAQRVLSSIERRTLLVHARHDPMVPHSTISAGLNTLSAAVEVFESKQGGHVGFPSNFSLGQCAQLGLESQVIAWLSSAHTSN